MYGELSLGALAWALCAHAAELRRSHGNEALFVDLGCGTGKCLLAAALCSFMAEARGVEVLPARAAVAAALAARFATHPPPSAAPLSCRVRVRCVSALDEDALPPHAAFVLLNWLMWPPELAHAMLPALEALRPGALVATVVVPIPSAAFRLLRARHVACSWGSADLLIHRRMEHGAAWQRRRRAAGRDVDELLCDIDALEAAGVLRALRLQRRATGGGEGGGEDPDMARSEQRCTRTRLLVSGCGDSALPVQLAAQLRGVAVHGTDLDPQCVAAQRHRAAAMTWRDAAAAPVFAAADVRDLPLDDATWRSADAEEEEDDTHSTGSGGDDADASDAAPRLFDALLDQCTLDALPCHRGGRALLHGALASLSSSLATGGVAVLLSQRPPEVAVPLLTAHPAMQWRLLSCTPVAASPAVTCFVLLRTGSAAADEALFAAWGSCTPATPPARCAFAVCGKAAAGQRWFECASCVAEAVCAACAAACHAGHALAPAPPPRSGRLERGFCDCGFSGRCKACGVPPLGDEDEPMPILP